MSPPIMPRRSRTVEAFVEAFEKTDQLRADSKYRQKEDVARVSDEIRGKRCKLSRDVSDVSWDRNASVAFSSASSSAGIPESRSRGNLKFTVRRTAAVGPVVAIVSSTTTTGSLLGTSLSVYDVDIWRALLLHLRPAHPRSSLRIFSCCATRKRAIEREREEDPCYT